MEFGVTVCVVTGASRGFGQAVCWELAARVAPGSVLLLVARTEETLRGETEKLSTRFPGLAVFYVSADLSTEDGVRRAAATAEQMKRVRAAETFLLINNAGSLGDISKTFADLTNMGEVDSYLSLNVSSALCFTSFLLRIFPCRLGLQRVVVNVSSIAAVKPFKSWTLYCAGKAARDMMFNVLAKEQEDVRVLNYGPGPMDTEMQEQVRAQMADTPLRMLFVAMKRDGKLVPAELSARKLLDVIQRDTYKSGDHVDFFDKI